MDVVTAANSDEPLRNRDLDCGSRNTSPEKNPIHRPERQAGNVRGLVKTATLSEIERKQEVWLAARRRKASTGSSLEATEVPPIGKGSYAGASGSDGGICSTVTWGRALGLHRHAAMFPGGKRQSQASGAV